MKGVILWQIRKVYKLKPVDIGISALGGAFVKLGLKLNSKELIRRGCILSDRLVHKYCSKPELDEVAEITFTKIILYNDWVKKREEIGYKVFSFSRNLQDILWKKGRIRCWDATEKGIWLRSSRGERPRVYKLICTQCHLSIKRMLMVVTEIRSSVRAGSIPVILFSFCPINAYLVDSWQ